MQYKIYTDGGYSIRHKEGASAYVILDEDGNIIDKYVFRIVNETSQRAELKAIIGAVSQVPYDSKVDLYTDSEYAINILTGKWQPHTNEDLIEMYRQHSVGKDITFHWVKGHSGDLYNEMCDDMCNQCVGYDLNEEFSHHKKEGRKVPTMKGNDLYDKIAESNTAVLNKDQLRRRLIEVRDKINEIIDDL